MADNLNPTSLSGLASVKGTSNNEGGISRFRTSAATYDSATNGKATFDGFLKTFLGDDKSSGGAGDSFSSHGRNNRQSVSESVSESKEKSSESVEAEEDAETEESPDGSLADAVEYASQMILVGLNGRFHGVSTDISVDLASTPGSLAGATYNATYNSEQVMSAVEDIRAMVEGGEWDELFSQVVGEEVDMAMDLDAFNKMAAELDATIVSVKGNEAKLLAALAAESAARNGMNGGLHGANAGTAENAGTFGSMAKAAEASGEVFVDSQLFSEKKLNQGIFAGEESGFAAGQNDGNHHGFGSSHYQSSTPLPSLARSDASNPAAMSTMMDQIENIERLSEAMRMASKNSVKNLTIQLTPAELGKVMLRVESRDGVVNAYLRVEQPEAVAQLGSNLTQLRENLKAAGVELGEFVIEQRGQNESLGDFSGQRHGQGGGESANRVRWSRNDAAADPDDPGDKPSSGKPGSLNLVA